MKVFFLSMIGLLFLLSGAVVSQEIGRNQIYVEIGGHAVFYSMNYERYVNQYSSLRVGYGYVPLVVNSHVVPVSLNFMVPLNTRDFALYAEGDIGWSYVHNTGSFLSVEAGDSYLTSLWLGIRIQPTTKGAVLRAGGLIIREQLGGKVHPWFGLSYGNRF